MILDMEACDKIMTAWLNGVVSISNMIKESASAFFTVMLLMCFNFSTLAAPAIVENTIIIRTTRPN